MRKTMCRVLPAVVAFGMFSPVAHSQLMGKPGNDYSMSVMEQDRLKRLKEDRQKKLLADAEHLLAMAQSLKVSVDATKKDELSVSVIKQADEIEKLAKSVKDRMRQ